MNQPPFQIYVHYLRSQCHIQEALVLAEVTKGTHTEAAAKALVQTTKERAAELRLPKDTEKRIQATIAELEKASAKNRKGLSKGDEAELAAAELDRFEDNFGGLSE